MKYNIKYKASDTEYHDDYEITKTIREFYDRLYTGAETWEENDIIYTTYIIELDDDNYEYKVRVIEGHIIYKTDERTDRYTEFDPDELSFFDKLGGMELYPGFSRATQQELEDWYDEV